MEYIDIEKMEKNINIKVNLFIYYKALLQVSYDTYKKYTKGIYDLPPISLRDLVDFKKNPVDISEVEPIENILTRFEVGACHMEPYQKRHTRL